MLAWSLQLASIYWYQELYRTTLRTNGVIRWFLHGWPSPSSTSWATKLALPSKVQETGNVHLLTHSVQTLAYLELNWNSVIWGLCQSDTVWLGLTLSTVLSKVQLSDTVRRSFLYCCIRPPSLISRKVLLADPKSGASWFSCRFPIPVMITIL